MEAGDGLHHFPVTMLEPDPVDVFHLTEVGGTELGDGDLAVIEPPKLQLPGN